MPVHEDDVGFESLRIFADISHEVLLVFSVEHPEVEVNYAVWNELREMLEESLDRGGYKRDPRKIAELVVTSFSEGYEHLVMTHKAWQTLKAHIAEVIVKHMPRIKAARS